MFHRSHCKSCIVPLIQSYITNYQCILIALQPRITPFGKYVNMCLDCAFVKYLKFQTKSLLMLFQLWLIHMFPMTFSFNWKWEMRLPSTLYSDIFTKAQQNSEISNFNENWHFGMLRNQVCSSKCFSKILTKIKHTFLRTWIPSCGWNNAGIQNVT